MKRRAFVSLFLVTAALLPGCPVYGDDGCAQNSDCPDAYVCDGVTGLCRPQSDIACSQPSECATAETCSSAGVCSLGDCTWPDVGCVAGFECSKQTGVWACMREGTTASGGGGNSSAGGGGASGAADSSGGGGTPPATGGAPAGTGGAT